MPKVISARKLVALAGIAGSLLWGTAANALTITIGAQSPGIGANLVTQMAQDDGQADCDGCTYGGANKFKFNSLSGTGIPVFNPSLTSEVLDSSSYNVSAKTFGGTLYIYVVEQGLSGTGTYDFTSGFTAQYGSNTVTETTWLDPTNGTGTQGLFGNNISGPANLGISTATPGYLINLGLATFPGLASSSQVASLIPVNTPFSVIELFKVVLAPNSSASSTITLAANCDPCSITNPTPLPAALPLFGGVLGGGLLFRRLRNSRKARKV